MEKADGALRRSSQTALYHILSSIVRLMAPILAFTAEEVWVAFRREGQETAGVHLTSFPQLIPGVSLDDEERSTWEIRSAVRQEVYKALEESRAARADRIFS